MKIIGKAIDVIFDITKWVITLLFSVLVVLVFMQVFNRFVLNASLTWSTEIANYSMMWIALLGSAMLLRNNGHMAINNILDALHGPAKKIITTISIALQAMFLISWIYGCVLFLPTVTGQCSPALHLNMAMVDSVFLITGILMLLAMFDYWIVKKGQEAAYSEEDELIKRMKEETGTNNAIEEGEG